MTSTTNRNHRGSSTDRRRRRIWLVNTYGDGETVVCSHCPEVLTVHTVTVDRIITGIDGGTYRRENIRPSCGPCNFRLGAILGNTRKKAKARALHGEV